MLEKSRGDNETLISDEEAHRLWRGVPTFIASCYA